jgi:pantetheine-phosphate adenylyltransferase
VYAGTFDPPSCGHLDIIARATRLCDRLVVAVARNPSKTPMFSVAERTALLRTAVDAELGARAKDVDVATFDGLIVEFARQQRGECFSACVTRVVRQAGLRGGPAHGASSLPDWAHALYLQLTSSCAGCGRIPTLR